MKKKNIMLGIVLFTGLVLLLCYIKPFVVSSKKLIADNTDECKYVQARLMDYSDLRALNIKVIENNYDKDLDKLIGIIDNLEFKRIKNPEVNYEDNYRFHFVGTYKDNDGRNITETVKSLSFHDNNIIFYDEGSYSDGKFYKIIGEEFDIKKVVEEI